MWNNLKNIWIELSVNTNFNISNINIPRTEIIKEKENIFILREKNINKNDESKWKSIIIEAIGWDNYTNEEKDYKIKTIFIKGKNINFIAKFMNSINDNIANIKKIELWYDKWKIIIKRFTNILFFYKLFFQRNKKYRYFIDKLKKLNLKYWINNINQIKNEKKWVNFLYIIDNEINFKKYVENFLNEFYEKFKLEDKYANIFLIEERINKFFNDYQLKHIIDNFLIEMERRPERYLKKDWNIENVKLKIQWIKNNLDRICYLINEYNKHFFKYKKMFIKIKNKLISDVNEITEKYKEKKKLFISYKKLFNKDFIRNFVKNLIYIYMNSIKIKRLKYNNYDNLKHFVFDQLVFLFKNNIYSERQINKIMQKYKNFDLEQLIKLLQRWNKNSLYKTYKTNSNPIKYEIEDNRKKEIIEKAIKRLQKFFKEKFYVWNRYFTLVATAYYLKFLKEKFWLNNNDINYILSNFDTYIDEYEAEHYNHFSNYITKIFY